MLKIGPLVSSKMDGPFCHALRPGDDGSGQFPIIPLQSEENVVFSINAQINSG